MKKASCFQPFSGVSPSKKANIGLEQNATFCRANKPFEQIPGLIRAFFRLKRWAILLMSLRDRPLRNVLKALGLGGIIDRAAPAALLIAGCLAHAAAHEALKPSSPAVSAAPPPLEDPCLWLEDVTAAAFPAWGRDCKA